MITRKKKNFDTICMSPSDPNIRRILIWINYRFGISWFGNQAAEKWTTQHDTDRVEFHETYMLQVHFFLFHTRQTRQCKNAIICIEAFNILVLRLSHMRTHPRGIGPSTRCGSKRITRPKRQDGMWNRSALWNSGPQSWLYIMSEPDRNHLRSNYLWYFMGALACSDFN